MMMHEISPLYESVRFLLIDTQKQLQAIIDYVESGDKSLIAKSLQRVDYIDNHHLNLIDRASKLNQASNQDATRIAILSYEHISFSLKNLSQQLHNSAYDLKSISSIKLIQKKTIIESLVELNQGLDLVIPAIRSDQLSLSIDICKLQVRIHKSCEKRLQKYKQKLKTGQQTEALLQACFIVKDIDQMATSLLRIGEGIVSANMGQFIQIERYQALEATLSAIPQTDDSPEIHPNDLMIHAMGETKSGCTISGVRSSQESESELLAVFKEGNQQKLLDEKKGIENWHQKFPGIAPEVYAYQNHGGKAALLFEYLTGKTFDKLLINNQQKPLKKALNELFKTLDRIWATTVISEQKPAHFMLQLKKRLNHIYEVHPNFNQKGFMIGKVRQASLEEIVSQAQTIETKLTIPNAVYTHGDFNTDNILYDALENQISFIDLHRSEYLDYVQDLSVLIVSFYRLNHFEPKTRKLIGKAMNAIYEFGQDYADKINDHDYESRMTLGLARSFLTSTRFVIDAAHAKNMHYKGRFLLEQLIQYRKKDPTPYQLPKEIFHDAI